MDVWPTNGTPPACSVNGTRRRARRGLALGAEGPLSERADGLPTHGPGPRLGCGSGRLKYWARGLPAPGLAYRELRLDQKGRLRGLRQAGLELRIDRYTEALGLSLPQKLSLKHETLRLKLVIQDWAIPR